MGRKSNKVIRYSKWTDKGLTMNVAGCIVIGGKPQKHQNCSIDIDFGEGTRVLLGGYINRNNCSTVYIPDAPEWLKEVVADLEHVYYYEAILGLTP